MVPVIAASGRSFAGAFAYYCHDKKAATTARVAWTKTCNMLTACAQKAGKVMAYTATHQQHLKQASGQRMSGRKLEKPVFAYSLSWHPEQQPSREHMQEAAQASLTKLGLSDHQAVIIAHSEEPHPHVHVIVNKVHPLTGLVAKLSKSKERLQRFASDYEREHGKIYCQQRETNRAKREKGERSRYGDPIIRQAWERSDNGRSFAAALTDKGYTLALGRKRLVVVDPHGKVHNPARHLDGVRAKDIQRKLADLDPNRLPDAETVKRHINRRNQKDYRQFQYHGQITVKAVNDQQDRHIAERSALFSKHHFRIERERSNCEEFYALKDKQRDIRDLKRKIKQANFWHRLTGKVRAWQDTLILTQKNLDNAQSRTAERLDALEAKRDQAMRELATRHTREKGRT